MDTYLRLETFKKGNLGINAINQDWLDRSSDLLLPGNGTNHTLESPMGPIIHFQTAKDLKNWALELKNEKTKRFGFTGTETTKQAIQKLKTYFPNETISGTCSIKLSGGHYCYHIFARIKSFLQMHRGDISVFGWEDLVYYITDYNMIDTIYYCSKCVNIAKRVGIKLPLPVRVNRPILQIKLNMANYMKEFI